MAHEAREPLQLTDTGVPPFTEYFTVAEVTVFNPKFLSVAIICCVPGEAGAEGYNKAEIPISLFRRAYSSAPIVGVVLRESPSISVVTLKLAPSKHPSVTCRSVALVKFGLVETEFAFCEPPDKEA